MFVDDKVTAIMMITSKMFMEQVALWAVVIGADVGIWRRIFRHMR